MLKKLQNKEQGFTIIEVMIVLVIAAVILLIVFLAVPALQRNSRNTQYNNEASAISAAASEWVSNNNNGAIPTNGAQATAAGTAIKTLANAQNITTVNGFTGTTAAITPTTSVATVIFSATCGTANATNTTYTPAAGSTRQAVIYYGVESTSGTIAKCIQTGV